MRYLFLLILLAVLAGLIGCGSGGGSGATTRYPVTINLLWPTPATRATTRAIPIRTQFVIVEAFIGTRRIDHFKSRAPEPGQPLVVSEQLDVPTGDVTFYAVAYASDPEDNYGVRPFDGLVVRNRVIDPTTGEVTGGTPRTASDPNPPLAYAAATRRITDPAPGTPPITLEFVMSNTIASLTPKNVFETRLNLLENVGTEGIVWQDAPGFRTVNLANSIEARDANGATLLFAPTELTWELDATDALADERASVSPDGILTLRAAGPVRIIVRNNTINTDLNQIPVQATIGYTIVPATVTIALPDDLAITTPLYAGSVRLTITEIPLNAADGDETPVIPPAVENTTYNPATRTLTINPVLADFNFTGRTFQITAEAFSGRNATGVLLARTALTNFTALSDTRLTQTENLYTLNATLFPRADYRITGFDVFAVATSDPPLIYAFENSPPFPGLSNQVQLRVALRGPDIAANSDNLIDPTTVNWSSSNPQAATVSANGLVSAIPSIIDETSVTITAQDVRFPNPPATGLTSDTQEVRVLPANFR